MPNEMAKSTSAESFQGFADASGSFFKKLAKNQNKDWFTAHKAEYEEGWHRPMEALLSEVRAREKKGVRCAAADTLKKPPKGVSPDHPRLDLLLRKGLVAGLDDFPRDKLTSRALLDACVKAARDFAPVVRWLAFATA